MGKASKLEVIEEAHELRQIKIRDSLVAPDHQHVFIVFTCRCVTEICGTGDQQWVLSQRINDHVFCMNIFDVGVQPAEVFLHPSFELVLRQDIGDRDLVEERCNVFICAFQQNISKIRLRMLEHFFKRSLTPNAAVKKTAVLALSIRCAYHLNRSRLDRGLNAVPTPVTGSPSEIGKISSFQGRISRISGSFCNSSQYFK